jgi:TP901 family phage tail tape measure protein
VTSPAGGLDSTATAVLRFDASAVRPGVVEANSALQGLYGTVKDNWWGVRNLGEVFATLGGAIVGGLAAAGSAAVGFEQSTAIIFKNVSDSATLVPSQLSKIRQGLLDLSTTSPVALDNLVKIAQQGALFGIASDQILDFTKKVADLTIGTNLTVSDIGNLKKVMNEFNLPVSQIDKLGSALFVVEKNTSATAPAILNMTTQMGALLHQIGATAPEALALSGVFVSLGARGQAAATATQNLFLKIGQASSANIPLFNNYARVAGLTSEAFLSLYKADPTEALVRIATGLGKVSKNGADLSSVLADLGQKNSRSVAALLDLAAATEKTAGGQKTLKEVIDLSTGAYKDTTAYQKEVATQSATTSNQIQILKNDFKVLTIGLGSELLPAINFVVTALQKIVLGFTELPTPLKDVVEILGAVGGGTLLFAGAMLLLLPRLAQAGQAVGQLKTFLVEYNAVRAEALAITEASTGAEAAADLASVKFGGNKLKQYKAAIAAEKEFQVTLRVTEALELAKVGAQTTATIATEASVAADTAYAEREALLAAQQAARIAGNGALVASLGAQAAAATLASSAAAEEALALQADAVAATEAVVALEANAAATAAGAAATAGAIPEITAFGLALDFALGPVGLIVLGITALIAAVVAVSYFMGSAKKETDAYKDSNQGLVTSLKAVGASAGQVANDFILADKGMGNLILTANQLGIKLSDLFQVIKGNATTAQQTDVFNKLSAAIKAGVPNAQALADKVVDLNKTIVASAAEARTLASATDQVDKSNKGATASTLGLSEANSKAAASSDVRARAELGLIDARRSLNDANVKVLDAEQKLAEVQGAAQHRAAAIKKTEDELASARIAQRAAVQSLQSAEEALKTARSDAAVKLQEDQDKLRAAYANQAADVFRVADAQKTLNLLQAGPILDDIIKATNALADARASLFHATETVADAEFNYQYLIGQGASVRDLADAQQAIVDAKNKQADATEKVTTATVSLAAAQAGPTQEDIAKATLKLVEAQNALVKSTDDIASSTRAVHKDQVDIAQDNAYKDALDKVTLAQIALDAANQKVVTSLHNVKAEQAGTAEAKAYRDAQLAVIDALYARAKAVVQVQKDTYESLTGKTFTAQQEVDALNAALQSQADTINGPIGDALRGYAVSLAHVPTVLPALEGPSMSGPGGPNEIIGKNGLLSKQLDGLRSKNEGILDKIFRFVDPRGVSGEILQFVLNPLSGVSNFLFNQFRPEIIGFFKNLWRDAGLLVSEQIIPFFDSLPSKLFHVGLDIGSGISRAFTSAFNGVFDALIPVANFLIRVVNDLIDGANTINHLNPFSGSDIKHINEINIPKHALGGVATKPSLGIFGEAGPEALVPLSQFANLFAPITALTAQLAYQSSSLSASRSAFAPSHGSGGGDTYNITAPTGNARDIAQELSFFSFSRK